MTQPEKASPELIWTPRSFATALDAIQELVIPWLSRPASSLKTGRYAVFDIRSAPLCLDLRHIRVHCVSPEYKHSAGSMIPPSWKIYPLSSFPIHYLKCIRSRKRTPETGPKFWLYPQTSAISMIIFSRYRPGNPPIKLCFKRLTWSAHLELRPQECTASVYA